MDINLDGNTIVNAYFAGTAEFDNSYGSVVMGGFAAPLGVGCQLVVTSNTYGMASFAGPSGPGSGGYSYISLENTNAIFPWFLRLADDGHFELENPDNGKAFLLFPSGNVIIGGLYSLSDDGVHTLQNQGRFASNYSSGSPLVSTDSSGNLTAVSFIGGGSNLSVNGHTLGNYIHSDGLIYPPQASSAPTYVLGAMYFDTTLSKLRIGGASGWETVTSV